MAGKPYINLARDDWLASVYASFTQWPLSSAVESEKSALSVLVEQGLHFPELTVYTAALGHPESAGIGRASSCNSPAQIAGMI